MEDADVTTGAGARGNRGSRWQRWLRPAASPEDRERILRTLFPPDAFHWDEGFGWMMFFSLVVAEMGLSEDSAAVVIGAMVIAPLLTPVLALAAALALARGRDVVREAITVAVAVLVFIGVAWVIGLLLPESMRTVTSTLLIRASPNVRDLVIGFAAGAAGAYAVARKDFSAALPGVAIAVALIPPIAAAGYALAAHKPDLARGAALMVASNLVGIVLAGAIVFLTTGLASPRRLAERSRSLAGIAGAVLAVVVVTVPLLHRSNEDGHRFSEQQQVLHTANAWFEPRGLAVTNVSLYGREVAIDVVGSSPPPPSGSLRVALARYVPGVAVNIRWFETG